MAGLGEIVDQWALESVEGSNQGQAAERDDDDSEDEEGLVSAEEGNDTGPSRTRPAGGQDQHRGYRNRVNEVGDIPAPKEKIIPFQMPSSILPTHDTALTI